MWKIAHLPTLLMMHLLVTLYNLLWWCGCDAGEIQKYHYTTGGHVVLIGLLWYVLCG